MKPENILLMKDGHIVLADFDLSFMTACTPQVFFLKFKSTFLLVIYRNVILTRSIVVQLIIPPAPSKRRRSKSQPLPTFVAEPNAQSNSFVGTEEYIAPVR